METSMKRHLKTCVLAAAATLLLFGAEHSPNAPFGLTLGQEAAAFVGRPLTPVSVAGVARRTTRRTVAVEATAATSAAAATTQQQQATAQQQQAVAKQQAETAQQQQAVAKQQAATAQQQEAVAKEQAAATAPALGTVVHALPSGCASAPKGGVEYQKCGNTYYRTAFQGNNLVYVVAQP
jgi:biotin carboxyl carrier protein